MQANSPKISVIIPTYNCAQYIQESINSILNQSYKAFEIIVIDDGSQDNTREILKPYINKKAIQYIYQQNQGVAQARNTGVKTAWGEYIAFLDADDIFLPECLMKKAGLLNENHQVSLVFTDYFVENSHGNIKRRGYFSSRYTKNVDLTPTIDKVHENVYLFKMCYYNLALRAGGWFFPSTCTVMVRKNCFEDTGSFDSSLKIGEDTDMWLRIMSKFKVAFINEPLSVYKTYRSVLTKNQELCHLSTIKLYKKIASHKNPELGFILHGKILAKNFVLVRFYLDNSLKKKALVSFIKSTKYIFGNSRNYFYLLCSFLPQNVYFLLRGMKRAIFSKSLF